ncbi:MAG: hypothetical protein KAJ19_05065 [Gammaproteobacteria bacterium]|nr:hypothetical protein [Gammaproteobacteria bacterium]
MAPSKKTVKQLKGLAKVKEELELYANEKAEAGDKQLAAKIRFALEEMENPRIQKCAKIIMEEDLGTLEVVVLLLLQLIATFHD